MPEWLTVLLALLTATGVGGVIAALINKRPTKLDPLMQMQVIVTSVQRERELDQKELADLAGRLNVATTRIDELFTQLGLHRQREIDLLAWGAAGGPPPPPKRPDGLK